MMPSRKLVVHSSLSLLFMLAGCQTASTELSSTPSPVVQAPSTSTPLPDGEASATPMVSRAALPAPSSTPSLVPTATHIPTPTTLPDSPGQSDGLTPPRPAATAEPARPSPDLPIQTPTSTATLPSEEVSPTQAPAPANSPVTLHTVIGSSADELVFSPDGRFLALGGRDGTIQMWGTQDWRQLWSAEHAGSLHRLAFSPDGGRLASANYDSSVARLWDVATGDLVTEISHPDWAGGPDSVAFSPDGAFLAVGGQRKIIVAEATSGVPLFDLTHDLRFTTELAFSPGGPWLVAVANNSWGPGRVIVWDVLTQESRVLNEYGLPLSSNAVFSPDARWLAGGGNEKYFVWETPTWANPTQLESPVVVDRFAFSPDGRWLVGSSSGEIRVWEVPTWRVVSSIAQEDVVWSLAFSPDSQWLVTGLGQGVNDAVNEAQLWAIPDGSLLARMHHPSQVLSVAFSPDGRWIASASQEVQIWTVTP